MHKTRPANDSGQEQTSATTSGIGDIGTRIRQIREALGKSREEVAAAARLDPAVVEALENGTAEPMLTTLTKVAMGLEVPLESIFSSLSPRGAVFAAAWDKAPEDLQEAVRAVLTYPWVKA